MGGSGALLADLGLLGLLGLLVWQGVLGGVGLAGVGWGGRGGCEACEDLVEGEVIEGGEVGLEVEAVADVDEAGVAWVDEGRLGPEHGFRVLLCAPVCVRPCVCVRSEQDSCYMEGVSGDFRVA